MRRIALAMFIAIAGLAAPGTALAVAPTATTGTATNLTGTTATLNGTVHPGKEPTTYRFEYGPTTAYGSQTPAGTVNGNSAKPVSATASGLTPATTYHFRVVATNTGGTVQGADAQFTTPAAGAAAVTIAVTPAIVTFGKPVTITGQVPGRPGARVELEQTPAPFTDPFKNAAQGTTDAAANYSFPVVPTLNTRYHVVVKAPPATSADVTVLVRSKVGLRLSDRTPARGARVRFRGTVLPAHDGKTVSIQRRTSAGWKTIASPVLVAGTPLNGVARSKYAKRIRIRRSGTYRTVMPADADHAQGRSPRRSATVH
jgi:hypothetical protein